MIVQLTSEPRALLRPKTILLILLPGVVYVPSRYVVVYQLSRVSEVLFNLPGVVCLGEALPSHEITFHTVVRLFHVKDTLNFSFLFSVNIDRRRRFIAFSHTIRFQERDMEGGM
jgi:hypothetical protein